MKKNFLSMFALAALFLAGCSSEEVTPSGEVNGANGEVETHYMAVNLMSADGTRATGDYELGSASENQVDKVRFYFFDENGDAANVKLSGSTYVNYYDWTPGDGTLGNEGDNVEKTLDATIVINTANGDKLPQQIVAVLNPTGALGNDAKDLSKLQAVFANYALNSWTTAGKFVMFNSVFRKNGAEYCAVPITAENLQKSEIAAINNPVTIYVERSVAKVQVTTDPKVGFENGKLALKDKDDKPILVDGQQVYLQLNAWSLTAETSNGRLVKKINPAWSSNWWNKSSQFRSVWAINSPSAVNTYGNYPAINGSFDAVKYTNENAAKVGADDADEDVVPAANNTKVILSGTLVKEDGTPFTIVRHLGAYLADTFDGTDESKNLLALKKSILNYFAAGGNNYYYDSDEIVDGKTETVRKQIDIDDVKIVYATQKPTENSKNNCYVYAQLTADAAGKTWYTSLDEDAEPLANAATTINNALKDKKKVDWALVWNEGMTYYYYEIEHNKVVETAADGETTTTTITYGVVRNHIYKTNITKIAGLGTPVYDPNQIIYPEKPDPNDHYIAAEINILSWRIVDTDYELEW